MTSFDFTWQKPVKQATAVLVKKRKIKPLNNLKSINGVSINTNKVYNKPVLKSKTQETKQDTTKNISDNCKSIPSNNNLIISDKFTKNILETNNKTYIKRKQKKEKLLVKNDEGTEALPSIQQKHNFSLFNNKHKKVYVNKTILGASLVEKVFTSDDKFSNLNIHKHIVSTLEKYNFTKLTNVQGKSIPQILDGKNVLIRSQTGSGKTLTYAVPIINFLLNKSPKLQRNDSVQALIIVPTRELALQTHEIFDKINSFQWIVVGHLCGGENRKTEKCRLRKGVHVLIATPGRLLDHMLHTSALKMGQIKYLVLDEADRLLEMGFKKDIIKIVEELDKAHSYSKYDPMSLLKQGNQINQINLDENINQKQVVLLSATMSKGIAELAEFAMKDHIYIDVLEDSFNINENYMVIPSTVKQEYIITYIKHRLFILSAILLAKSQQNSKIFVFMATNQMVNYHYELFKNLLVKMPKIRGKLKTNDNIWDENDNYSENDDDVDDQETILNVEFFKLHGSMDQCTRKKVFTAFRSTKKGVLLCTDVAARGIDVPEADCVIQYTGPQSDEDYLHRVGRTGRMGKCGNALIFLTYEEQEYVTRLQKHKIFLQETDINYYLKHLCILMNEPNAEEAATILQKHFEQGIMKNANLHKLATFAYSSWSRFYNTYPSDMKSIFNFKNTNLGHYVTSFGLSETPSNIAKHVKKQIQTIEPKKLNKKLTIHSDDLDDKRKSNIKITPKRKIKSISLTTSEYASGLDIIKNKKRKIKK